MASVRPPELERLFRAQDPTSAEEAWEAFLRSFSPTILSVTRRVSGDYDEAMDRYRFILEELKKDGFGRLRAYEIDPRCRFSTWLAVVSRRLCVDYHRKRYGRKRPAGKAAEDSRTARRRLADMMMEELDPGRIQDRSGLDPERQIRQEELSSVLEAVMAGLAPEDRLLIKLRFEDGLPAKAVAQTMRYPTVFHVYRRLNPLLMRLRKSLEAKGVHEARP